MQSLGDPHPSTSPAGKGMFKGFRIGGMARQDFPAGLDGFGRMAGLAQSARLVKQ